MDSKTRFSDPFVGQDSPSSNRFTSKLKHTGDRNTASYRGATSGSPVFSIAAAGALRGEARFPFS